MSNKLLWSKQSERWKNVGAPTRPTIEDENNFKNLSFSDFSTKKIINVMIAGVTPELVNNIPWPSNVNLQAFDISLDMIEQNWNPPSTLKASVKQADWRDLPLDDNSIDLIIGDGIFTALGDSVRITQVLIEFKRVLNHNGKIVFRNFIRPDFPKNIEDVLSDVKNQKVENFGTLKWLLATSLTDKKTSTVEPKKIHSVFEELFPNREELSKITSWSLEQISTIDSYSHMDSTFYFPTNQEIIDKFENIFNICETSFSSYEWSQYCPFVKLKHK